jgi:hypothetical protein
MKLKAIIAIAFGFVLATDALKASASSVPEGDQHVALLAQQLNDVDSALNLFQRCINQNRPSIETLNALNVLADNFDRLCAHVLQFYVWAKTENTSGKLQFEFSPAALEQLRDLNIRINTVMQDEWKEVLDAVKQKPQYARDPAMQAVGERMLASLNVLQTFKEKADKQ